jgi:hypothetical protein
MLGGALLGQQRYDEAEPLLRQGCDGLYQRRADIPPTGRPRLTEAIQRLVQLYEVQGKMDEADPWRRKLEAATNTASTTKP